MSSSGAALDVAPESRKAYLCAFSLLIFVPNVPLPCWWVVHLQLLTWPFPPWCYILARVHPVLQQANGDQYLDVCSLASCIILVATI